MKCWSQGFFISIWILLCPADWQCMADYCWTVSFRTIFHKSHIFCPWSTVCAINTSYSTSAAGAPGFGGLCHIFSVCAFEMSKWFNSEKIRIGWVLLHRLNKKFVLLSVDREKEDSNNSKVKKIWIQMLNMTKKL